MNYLQDLSHSGHLTWNLLLVISSFKMEHTELDLYFRDYLSSPDYSGIMPSTSINTD